MLINSRNVLILNIIDAELELVPEIMQDDYQIRKVAKNLGKKYDEMLLDSNYMHGAIERFFPGKSNRMGRPDIFHTLLNFTQDSILNKKNMLRVNIHTKNNQIIRIAPETRIPKSYNRFAGLMEKLLAKGDLKSPEGKTLLSIENGSWENLLSDKYENVLLSPSGEKIKASDIPLSLDASVFIGGFSEGDFTSNVYEKMHPYSIFHEELTIWTIAAETISTFERKFDLL